MSLFRDLMIAGCGYDYKDIVISSGSSMTVLNGVKAKNVTVEAGGRLIVFSGGTALNIVENGGLVSAFIGATVGFVPNVIENVTLSVGTATIHSGGTANSATVNGGGRLFVFSGGIVDSATVNSSGFLTVSSGGTANSGTVNSSGLLTVSSGGTALNIVENGGFVSAHVSATVGFVPNVIEGMAVKNMTVHSGTTANSIAISGAALVHVFSSGIVDGLTIGSGRLYVSSGGTANSVAWAIPSGRVYAMNGTITYTMQKSGCYLLNGNTLVSSGDTLTTKNLVSGQDMLVFSGGLASATTISSGNLYVHSGGTALRATVKYKGGGNEFHVYSGGTAFIITVSSAGRLTIWGSALASDIETDYGGSTLLSGGTANNATVSSGGRLFVFSSGIVDSATVSSGGRLYVSSGGTALAVTSRTGALITVSSGGYIEYA